MDEKERLEARVVEYLRASGYTGLGRMSRELNVSRGRVQRKVMSFERTGLRGILGSYGI